MTYFCQDCGRVVTPNVNAYNERLDCMGENISVNYSDKSCPRCESERLQEFEKDLIWSISYNGYHKAFTDYIQLIEEMNWCKQNGFKYEAWEWLDGISSNQN